MRKREYFIGVDAHSKNCFFVFMNARGQVLQRHKVSTSEANILELVGSLSGHVSVACEEGALSQWLYLLLAEKVDQLVFCDPAANKKKPGPKTDFLDATELADLLRVGRLSPVFHEDSWRMELRCVISAYDDIVTDGVRAKNRYKALFRQHGLSTTGADFYRDKERCKEFASEAARFVAEPLQLQIDIIEQMKAGYVHEFECYRRAHREIQLLASIPGIGTVRAVQLVGIIVEPHRFADKYKFFSYAMLVKHKQMSDGRNYGQKRSYGKTQLKDIFRGAALAAIGSDNAFARKYEAMLAAGHQEKAARKAIARAIAATVLGVWKSNKMYDDNCWEGQQRHTATCTRAKAQASRVECEDGC